MGPFLPVLFSAWYHDGMCVMIIIMILLDVPGTSFARFAFFLVLLQETESSLQAADSLAYTPLQRAIPVSLFA